MALEGSKAAPCRATPSKGGSPSPASEVKGSSPWPSLPSPGHHTPCGGGQGDVTGPLRLRLDTKANGKGGVGRAPAASRHHSQTLAPPQT